MSAFLFGDFFSSDIAKEKWEELEVYFKKKDAYIWLDDNIDFYKDIQLMLQENPRTQNNHSFAITTKNQPRNSHDLLLPWDKYEKEELFPDGTGYERSRYNELASSNLDVFYDLFLQFMKVIKPQGTRVFVVMGYDTQFEIERYSIKQMVNDLKEQVQNPYSVSFDSVIYEITE